MSAPAVASAHVDVPLDQADAFDTFTTEIGDWFVINPFTVPDPEAIRTVRIEAGVGGRLLYVKDSGAEDVTAGTITTWDPPRRFSFIDGRDLEVTVSFTARPGGCRVTVEEVGFEKLAPEVVRRVRPHSWHRHLPEWFQEHVAKGKARQ